MRRFLPISLSRDRSSRPNRSSPEAWYWIGLGYLSLFTYGFIDNSRGPIFPDVLKDYQLSDSVGSLFFLVSSAAALLNNTFFSRWLNRTAGGPLLRIYSLVQIVGLLLIGLSPTFVVTLLGALIIGIAFGGLSIAQNHLITENAPRSIRRRLFAGLHSTYGLASLMAPMAVSMFYLAGFRWRFVLSSLSLGPLAVFLFARSHRQKQSPRPASEIDADAQLAQPAPRREALYFAWVSSLYVVAEISISSRLALLARREWGFDPESANRVLATFFAAMFIGRFLFAALHFPWRNRQILLFGGGLGFAAFVIGMFAGPWWLALSGLGMSVFYPCIVTLIADEQGPRARAITSIAITSQSLGLIFMHFILGAMADSFGLGRALWLGPICLGTALVLLLFKERLAPIYVRKTVCSETANS